MGMNPLVSIITVCYNSEKTIINTIESVLNQTYTNIEYILVDGSSKDNTVNIIKSYEEKFKRKGISYRWISESDNGIYDAMNKGIGLSAGNFIGIINSDDWYERDALENIKKAYSQNFDKEIFYGNMFKILNKKKILGKGLINLKKIDSLRLNHPTMFVKNEVYKRVGRFDLEFPIGADRDFVMRALNKGIKFMYIDKIISNFSLEGISSDYSKFRILKKRIIEEYRICKKNSLPNQKLRKIIFKKSLSGFINYFIMKIFGEEYYHKYLSFKFSVKK